MTTQTLIRNDGTKLAYDLYPNGATSSAPGVVFLHGFRSDRNATKATYLVDVCKRAGLSLIKFDCYAHGQSEGAWEDFTIGRAVDDALLVLNTLAKTPQIIVGSSMGGWVALRCMLENPQKMAAFIGVAAAPDFTLWVERDSTPAQREAEGFTQNLLAEAKNQLVMDKNWGWQGPVHLLQGQNDADVPWQTALAIRDKFAQGCHTQLTLIPDGDHRLNREQDLKALENAILSVKKLL